MKLSFLTLFSFGAMAAGPAIAQSLLATPEETVLPPVSVTSNPLGTSELAVPSAQYTGTELLVRTQSTLGETLDGTPGVASTYFGPNASRPVIRGLDGDRLRVLSNGSTVADVSNLSYDHAVTVDPLSVERVEVLRGPGALLYGGNAVGGVVNVLDGRIARAPLFDARGGMAAKLDLGLGGAGAANSAALVLDGGTDRWALHGDAFRRVAQDVAVPAELACSKPGSASVARAICNSASHSDGAGLGASLLFAGGYVGASVGQFNSRYGTVAEDDVTIGMQSTQFAMDAAWTMPTGVLRGVKAHLGHVDYRHTEYEGATVGTVFGSRAEEVRLELRHAPLGAWEGVIGVHAENSRFSATGEEAFAPFSRTRQMALFVYEELPLPWGRISGGVRLDHVSVRSDGNPDVSRFWVGSRTFQPLSYAVGAVWSVAAQWQATANVAYSERAPKDYELFANGPHLATHAYEMGDATLRLEKSANLDLGLNWKSGAHRVALNAFVNTFDNYITQVGTGAREDDLDVYAYRQDKARLSGLEGSARLRLVSTPSTLDLELRADTLQARNTTTGEPLPRIAPSRLSAHWIWNRGGWNARAGFRHSAAQRDVPAGQLATPAHTFWNAALTYTVAGSRASQVWYARVDNITDALAYPATSILTQTAPGKAPLPGRSIKLGLRVML